MTRRTALLILLVSTAPLAPRVTAQEAESSEQAPEPVYQFQEEQTIQSALDEVFRSSDYRRLGREPEEIDEEESNAPPWLERLLDRFFEWLSTLFSNSDEKESDPIHLPNLAWLRWVVYGVVALLLIWIVAIIVGAAVRRTSGEEPTDKSPTTAGEGMMSTPPGEHPSQEYLRRAVALAEAGDYRAAMRQLLLGTMSWIERHDLIRYRRGLSNRDYLRAVYDRPTLYDPLSRIVRDFERIYFGRRDASKDGFQVCLRDFRKAFEAE